MAEPRIDAAWALAAAAAQGATLEGDQAAELARTLERSLEALDALAERRRFEDEPASHLRALLRHRQRPGREGAP